MPWGTFGDVVFNQMNTPVSVSADEGAKYAEHPRIENKAVLQWTGHNLRKIKLGMIFQFQHSDPEKQAQTLQRMMNEHKSYPLIIGGGGGGTIGGYRYSSRGIFQGNYVIESLAHGVKMTDKSGRIIRLEITASLLECIDDKGLRGKAAPTLKVFGRLF